MKFKLAAWVFLAFVAVAMRLPAQQSDAAQKFLEGIRTKAEKGDAVAQCALGFCYYNGDGFTKDFAEAVNWYQKSAEQGNEMAQYNLGRCYENGDGVTKDVTKAAKLYRKAAEQGFAPAQNSLALCLEAGEGEPQDYVESVRWYRKAADQGDAPAQANLASCYERGEGVNKDAVEAVKWYRKAAEQGIPVAQYDLGLMYDKGVGVAQDYAEAEKLFRKSAGQGFVNAQFNLATLYYTGKGVLQDYAEAAKWYNKAANQGHTAAQFNMGNACMRGDGVAKDYIEAYKWFNLAAAKGDSMAVHNRDSIIQFMSPVQIAEGQRLCREFNPQKSSDGGESVLGKDVANSSATGTGFFITDDGFLITNEHVVHDATHIRLLTDAGLISARVVKVDSANDLALLKAEGKFMSLPIASSRPVRLGNTVAMVGFPNIGLQGFAPKFARGEIAALSGAHDDARYFQISVPVQPGNSGSALVDERGNVVGVVSAKLNMAVAIAASGAMPENVNYAVKSSFLLSFLESVPDVDAKLKAPNTNDEKFEDMVESAQNAAVLILVY